MTSTKVPSQPRQQTFVDDVLRSLARAGLPPGKTIEQVFMPLVRFAELRIGHI